jgi:hypothetical protein
MQASVALAFLPRHLHHEFVLAAGWGTAIDVGGLAERGVDALLAKPYRVKQLRELVAELSRSATEQTEAAASAAQPS